MARSVFCSFHHQPDLFRVQTIRDAGLIDGNQPARDAAWEAITRAGDTAIETWIADQMNGRPVAIVFVGAHTAQRKWIDHEIKRAWDKGMGVVGIHIHRLLNSQKQPSAMGANPFLHLSFLNAGAEIPCHDPPGWNSASVLQSIAEHMNGWIDEAVALRAKS